MGELRELIRWKYKHAKRIVRVPFEWAGIAVAFAILTNVSHKTLFTISDLISWVMYCFDFKGRKLSLVNLRIMRGKIPPGKTIWSLMHDPNLTKATKQEQTIIRRSYRNMARTVAHAFWTSKNAAKRVASVGRMDGKCENWLKENSPTISVSAHLGCWEMLSQLVCLRGHSMVSVAKNIGTRGMTKLLMKSRKSIGQEILPAEGAFRPLMQALKDGKDIGLLVDQFVNRKDGGIWVWFMGRPMCVSVAPAFLCAKSHAPIVVAWSQPMKDDSYLCRFIGSIAWQKGMNIRQTTIDIMKMIEKTIKRHPSCWILNYRYFNEEPFPEEIAELMKSK